MELEYHHCAWEASKDDETRMCDVVLPDAR